MEMGITKTKRQRHKGRHIDINEQGWFLIGR